MNRRQAQTFFNSNWRSPEKSEREQKGSRRVSLNVRLVTNANDILTSLDNEEFDFLALENPFGTHNQCVPVENFFARTAAYLHTNPNDAELLAETTIANLSPGGGPNLIYGFLAVSRMMPVLFLERWDSMNASSYEGLGAWTERYKNSMLNAFVSGDVPAALAALSNCVTFESVLILARTTEMVRVASHLDEIVTMDYFHFPEKPVLECLALLDARHYGFLRDFGGGERVTVAMHPASGTIDKQHPLYYFDRLFRAAEDNVTVSSSAKSILQQCADVGYFYAPDDLAKEIALRLIDYLIPKVSASETVEGILSSAHVSLAFNAFQSFFTNSFTSQDTGLLAKELSVSGRYTFPLSQNRIQALRTSVNDFLRGKGYVTIPSTIDELEACFDSNTYQRRGLSGMLKRIGF